VKAPKLLKPDQFTPTPWCKILKWLWHQGYHITWFGHHGNPHHPYSLITHACTYNLARKDLLNQHHIIAWFHMWSAPSQPPLLSVVLNLVPELLHMTYSTIFHHAWHHYCHFVIASTPFAISSSSHGWGSCKTKMMTTMISSTCVLQNGKTRWHRSYATISLATVQSIKTRLSRSNHLLR